MARFLKQSELRADIDALRSLLTSVPQDDFLGRIGLESRLTESTAALAGQEGSQDNLASTALYFGGKPVIGSVGIEADFAATAIADFKDLIVKVWATSETPVAAMGPVPNKDSAQLHVTALLHGSMGFLIEEIDQQGTPLFPTPLKRASDDAARLIVSMATLSDDGFQAELERIPPRVFASVQKFFKDMHRAEASIRLVDDSGDRALDREAIDNAFVRLDESLLDEVPVEEDGLLLGIIPNAGRFEFRTQGGQLLEGKVAPTLSETYLKRIEEQQGIGKWFHAKLLKKEFKRWGKASVSYTLTDLEEVANPGLATRSDTPLESR
jgi:hypothetical protein